MTLQYYKDSLATEDPKAIRRALEHLIGWHEIYGMGAEHRTEIGYMGPDHEGMALITEQFARGVENFPGYIIYERQVTEWVQRVVKPVVLGRQVDILPSTAPGP